MRFAQRGRVAKWSREQVDRLTTPELRTLLDLSQTSLVVAGITLLVAVVLGIWAAIAGGHFSRTSHSASSSSVQASARQNAPLFVLRRLWQYAEVPSISPMSRAIDRT